jgi:uncharacterized delta-60 repeat protein
VTPTAGGKFYIGGSFTEVTASARTGIARMNANGTLDTTFVPPAITFAGSFPGINKIAVQSDGKVVIVGGFSAVGGVARGGVARLNTDGSLDTDFGDGLAGANDNTVRSVAIQSDDQILISGNFTSINGTARSRIARLNTDGTLDTTFVPPTLNGTVLGIALSEGKIVIVGRFSLIDSLVVRNGIARLDADGTLDANFNFESISNLDKDVVAVDGAGKILVGGTFARADSGATADERTGLLRLNADGTLDTTFNPFPDSSATSNRRAVRSLQVQADGKIVVGGNDGTFSSTTGFLARVNADGTTDDSFVGPEIVGGSGTVVNAVVVVGEGRILFGGTFTQVGDVLLTNLARVIG